MWTEARLLRPLALRAARKASCTLFLGMGADHGHADPPTTWRREKPAGMAVGFPVLAQQLERPLGQGDIAVPGAFATAHVDEHTGTSHVGNLRVRARLQAQATGVYGRQGAPG